MFTRRPRSERGAVATLVVILLAFGVLFGAAALSIDVGRLALERRHQQNATDAAAMRLASICSRTPAACTPGNGGTMGTINALITANGVQHDAATSQQGVAMDPRPGTSQGMCGRGIGTLPTCPSAGTNAAITDLTQCPALPSWLSSAPAIKYVETYTRTNTAGSSILPRWFSTRQGSTVRACARAAYGPASSGSVAPITFSLCEFLQATNNNTTFGLETALPLKYAKTNGGCPYVPSGGDFSGGFGFLTQYTACLASIDVNGWVDAQTGVGGGNGCASSFDAGKTVYLPIFDCISDGKTFCVPGNPTGTHTWYHIKGFAAFYITAVDITGQLSSNVPGYPSSGAKKECTKESKDNKCIYGWFVNDWVDSLGAIDPNGTNYGAVVINPAG